MTDSDSNSDFNPTSTADPAQTIPLTKTRRDFIEHKRKTQKQSTARAYKYPTKSFLQYAKERGVTVPGDITRGLVNGWIEQRQQEVKPVTVHNNAKHIRVFIKWLAQHDYTDWGIHLKITIPDVPDRGDVNEQIIAADQAEAILEYLGTYHYATTYHALFKTLWHTGCRISGALALDVEDFQVNPYGNNSLRFQNRPETDTPLKNKSKSEREVNISDNLTNILQDYIDTHRYDVTDEYGREPLFTSEGGRLYRQRSYKNIVALTRPCITSNNCPHDRGIDDCEAAIYKEKSSMCPSSLAHHPIRKGAIGNHLNENWTKEVLSERVDVSGDVLEKHYDLRSEERKRKNRAKYLHE